MSDSDVSSTTELDKAAANAEDVFESNVERLHRENVYFYDAVFTPLIQTRKWHFVFLPECSSYAVWEQIAAKILEDLEKYGYVLIAETGRVQCARFLKNLLQFLFELKPELHRSIIARSPESVSFLIQDRRLTIHALSSNRRDLLRGVSAKAIYYRHFKTE